MIEHIADIREMSGNGLNTKENLKMYELYFGIRFSHPLLQEVPEALIFQGFRHFSFVGLFPYQQ